MGRQDQPFPGVSIMIAARQHRVAAVVVLALVAAAACGTAIGTDEVRADVQLVRFAMDQAIGRGAADALRPHDLVQVRIDFV